MESICLNEVLRNQYDAYVSFIREDNIKFEREYFEENKERIPMSEIMQGASYEDHYRNFKRIAKKASPTAISRMFLLLQEYFLFSSGHDMMFKEKLKADIFTYVPMEDFIYPKLMEVVKEKYNDVSVMRENPNFNANMEGINKLVLTFMDMQSLLYLLYCNDFQLPHGWEKICLDHSDEIFTILNHSNITIGDFLHALVDSKCKTMKEIFSEIENPQLKRTYLEKVETLREEKQEEIESFAHVDLPITYFFNHTLSDFIHREQKSSIFEDKTPTKAKKILLPKC